MKHIHWQYIYTMYVRCGHHYYYYLRYLSELLFIYSKDRIVPAKAVTEQA